jgi:hypothetical protein
MKRVLYAKLHDGFFVPLVRDNKTGRSHPGPGEFKNTLPPDSKTIPGFEMFELDDGRLYLKWTGHPGVHIGAANVKCVVLAAEEEKPSNDSKTSSNKSA